MSGYDVVIVGSGPGGYVAAIRAAQLGLATAVVERDRIGGRCLNEACIPAKAVLRSADTITEVRDAGAVGIVVAEPRVDVDAVQAWRTRVVTSLTKGVAGLLAKNGVDVLTGTASLTESGGVAVDGAPVAVRRGVILAAGSTKRPLPGIAFGGRVIGTEEAWALDVLPASMAVIGAGASGSEIASAYARLGTRVTLLEGLDRVLPSEDEDVSAVAARAFRKQGIDVRTGVRAEDVVAGDAEVSFTAGGERLTAEWLVVATGRTPDVDGLGLDRARVARGDDGLIVVDGAQRTTRAGVWAIGDLTAGPALAHKASDEGVIAAEDVAGRETEPLDRSTIPRATFCSPNVGSFGLTEAQAREAGHDVVVGRAPFSAVGAGTVYGERTGFVKLVGERTYGSLLGAHVVGAKATELIQQLVDAHRLEGGYAEIARTVHGHPTLSEAVMEAARAADGWLIHG